MKMGWYAVALITALAGCRQQEHSAAGFVYLGVDDRTDVSIPVLKQEIVRQSIGIAIRDASGLVCRDAALEEPEPEQTEQVFHTKLNKQSHDIAVEVISSVPEFSFETDVIDATDYARLLETSEQAAVQMAAEKNWSNSDRQKNLSHLGKINLSSVDSAGYSSLFELLRGAHKARRLGDDSEECYEALIRGYANLGLQTSYLWSPSYKVYQARSLVYAQQYVRLHPDSRQALYLRAYAFGLCGLHARAAEDLTEASQMPAEDVPEWVPLLEDFIDFKTEALFEKARQRGVLSYTAWVLALETQKELPFKSRVFEAYESLPHKPAIDFYTRNHINEIGGVGSMHETSRQGFDGMTRWLIHLRRHPMIPEETQNVIDEGISLQKRITGIISTARRDGGKWPNLYCIPEVHQNLSKQTESGQDQGEPSLSTLGDLIFNQMFSVVMWRQYFMDQKWSVDIDDYTKEALLYVAGHRYADLLKAFAAQRHQNRNEYLAILQRSELNNISDGAQFFFDELLDEQAVYGGITGIALKKQYMDSLDEVHRDLQCRLVLDKDKAQKLALAETILKISPQSLFGRRNVLTYDKNWEDCYEQFQFTGLPEPEVTQIAAWRLWRDKRYNDAIPYYKQALSKINEIYVIRRLADCYLKTGNEALWLETMESTLELPDKGLNHANTRVEIAKKYMRDCNISLARNYANAAAKCYSQWALSLAGECAAIDGDQKQALTLLMAEQRRYENNIIPWNSYFRAQVYSIPGNNHWFMEMDTRVRKGLTHTSKDKKDDVFRGFYYWRNQRLTDAADSFAAAFKKKPDVWYSILRALVLLERGDRQEYMHQLDNMINAFDQTADKSSSRRQIRNLAMLMKDYADGAVKKEELKNKLAALKSTGTLYASDFYFFTGKFLSLVGRDDEAVEFYYKGIAPGQISRWAGPFCYLELKDRKLPLFVRYQKS